MIGLVLQQHRQGLGDRFPQVRGATGLNRGQRRNELEPGLGDGANLLDGVVERDEAHIVLH